MADSKNTLKEDDGDNGEPLVIVEDESKLTATDPNLNEDEDDEDEDGDDRKIRNGDEEDVDPDNPDSDRAALQESRRRERQERKKRRRESVQRDRIELDFLRKQNEELERRLSGVEQRTHKQDLGAMDAQIAQALNEVEMADKVIAKAVAAGNGDDVAQALKYRDQARERAAQLNFVKQQAAVAPAPDAAGGMDRRAIAHAQKFLTENKWYDPQGGNEESAIVLAIDATLVRDGYDPKTEEYWDELRDRAARRLPERFGSDAPAKKEDASARKPRGGPAVSSGREHAPATTRREVYISPERKQALIDAGVWDDPVLRDKYVRRYAEYDRNKRQ